MKDAVGKRTVCPSLVQPFETELACSRMMDTVQSNSKNSTKISLL